jgi:hypothetical protein
VLNLGKVVTDRPAYHTKCLIYPVGFVSERPHASYARPGHTTNYTSTIQDNGDAPSFTVTAADDPSNPVCAVNPTAAWKTIEQRLAASGGGLAEGAGEIKYVSGAAYFGLVYPSVSRLLLQLPGVDQCTNLNASRKR